MPNGRGNNDEKAEAETQPSHRQVSDRPRPRILVVEDDPVMRDLLSRLLHRCRYTVSMATNGQEAVAIFRQTPYDLVVTDLNMPVMGGAELVAAIKGLSNRTPIIVITGMGPEVADGVSEDAEAVFYKPFALDRFAEKIARLLE